MSDARKPKIKEAAEDAPVPKLEVESQPGGAAPKPLSPEQSYLQRKAEVTQQDHGIFRNTCRKRSPASSSRKCKSPSRRQGRRPGSTGAAS